MIEIIDAWTIVSDHENPIPWYHITDPSPEELDQLTTTYGIPKDFILSGTDEDEPPRQEDHTNDKGETYRLFVFLYPIDRQEDNMNIYRTLPISIVLSNRVVLTTTPATSDILPKILKKSKV